MLLELYFTFLRLALEYGDYQAMLIIGFLTSLPVFAAAIIAKLAFKKVDFPWYFNAFIATEVYFLLTQIFLAFWYKTGVSLFAFFEPATYIYVIFVVPMIMAYRKIMKKWPVLPWHFLIYVLSFLTSLVFWYFLVFYYAVFALV